MEESSQELCHICRLNPASSFEHFPPKAAFNNQQIRRFDILEWVRKKESSELVLGALMRRGSGDYTLCADCNSKTGSWYAPELIQWSKAGVSMLQKLSSDVQADKDPKRRMGHVIFRRVHPLRFLKEIVAMLLSVNGVDFSERNPELARFVLDKQRQLLPNRYRFSLSLFRGPNARFHGLAGKLNISANEVEKITELAYPPFSYILYLDSPDKEMPFGEITHFASFSYDDCLDLELKLEIGFGHSMFPGDFRSKAAMDLDASAQS